KIESSENVQHPWSGKRDKEAESVFAKTYPAIHAWFEPFRSNLKKRQDQGHYFWELRSCIYWREFEQPKIVYPDIYEHQSFAWDENGYYSVNTTYFIPTDEKWLCALLNSRGVEWFYSHVSNKVRGGYLRAFSDYITQIPIPKITEKQETAAVSLVDRILAAKEHDPDADVSELEGEIDELVYQLYGLTKEEIKIVEGSLNRDLQD
ncbi:MAG TPA: TaqI-like C-terminal specificity domain-containing protein, partial [bacterium]|nr:TaqI-like C-terminal specificity domain-containing protein [bacterium]